RGTVEAIRREDGRADAIVCDVSDAASVAQAFEAVDQIGGRVDILVNNAGIAHVGTIETTSEADLDRLFSVNVKGVFHCARAALSRMLQQGGGVILNMASIYSLIGRQERIP